MLAAMDDDDPWLDRWAAEAVEDGLREGDPRGRGPLSATLDASDPGASSPRAASRRTDRDPRALNPRGVPWAPQSEIRTVGPYRILEQLGSGGLGTVYRAERDDEEFSRQVALKLVRWGFETPQVQERFRLERQILAKLDHPNIARLYDGGTTDDGRPYFVMELVEGRRLDDWCRAEGLDLRRRLELMRKVCDAVHYAHRNLVLHRDLKPSNILVHQDGEPKLLDFGIAKVIQEDPDRPDARPVVESPLLTETGHLLLTPEFAAPEQVRGETLTTASDVYSLGVLLYLLATGEPPYTMDRRRASEVERVVCGVVPERPSAVARRGPENAAPGWSPPGSGDDFDNIVGMALRKEPERRYGSAAELSEDLRRYLADLPVRARPDSLTYRARKFVRRNRVSVTAALLVFLTLVAAVVVTTWQARVAIYERSTSEEVTDLLMDTFNVADPYSSPETITVRELLNDSALRIRGELQGNPRLRAQLLATLGRVHRNLSLYDSAEDLLEEAVYLARLEGSRYGGSTDPWIELASLRLAQSRPGEAEVLLLEALERSRGWWTRDEAQKARILRGLGEATALLDRYDEAQGYFERALHLSESEGLLLQEADVLDEMGKMWFHRRELEEAHRCFEQALVLRRRHLGENHPSVGEALGNVGAIFEEEGDRETAAEYYEQALEVLGVALDPSHSTWITIQRNLGWVRLFQKRWDEAEAAARQTVAKSREALGPGHPAVAAGLRLLARVHGGRAGDARREGRSEAAFEHWQEADRTARQALEIDRAYFGPDHVVVTRGLFLIADLARVQRRPEAANLLREVVAAKRRIDPDDVSLGQAMVLLAEAERNQGNFALAEEELRRALEELRRLGAEEDGWEIAEAQGRLALSIAAQGRSKEAFDLLGPALERCRSIYPDIALTRELEALEERLSRELGL